MEELLNITYKKKNGEWSGTRPTITLAKFNELLAKAKEESEEIDIVKLWVKAAGGVKRGRVFGFGSGLSDVPPELLEKYSFAKVHKPDLLQSHGEFHTFREDTKQQVSTLKTEVSSLNEQLNTVKNLVQNMALQLQRYPSFQGYPTQFQFPTMQAQFRCNPTPIQGPFTNNEVPTTFTNLLNSNFMFGSLDTSMHPPGPLMANNLNTPNDSGGDFNT